MAKQMVKSGPKQAKGEIEQAALENKLKYIALQDEIFQARKKMKESDDKIADLANKLVKYLQEKENQIAEVMFTAHMNAQRIEAQGKSQTEFYLLEMEEELRRKLRELEKLGIQIPEVPEAEINVPSEIISYSNVFQFPIPDPYKARVRPEVLELPPEPATFAEPAPINESDQVGAEVQVAPDPAAELTTPIESESSSDTTAGQEAVIMTAVEPRKPVRRRNRSKSGTQISTEAGNKKVDTSQPTEIKPDVPVAIPKKIVPPPEPNERMRLDAFIDARYYENVGGEKVLQNHALQIGIEVEVPASNYSVRYTKVSSDVVHALHQFDSVVLNDVYPFDIIDPNPQSIANYLYNYVEDTLSLMDLELHSLKVHELPDLEITVEARCISMDRMLHGGENALHDIRDILIPCVEPEPEDSTLGRLNKMLKRN
jgi:hypothetical protein